MPASDDIEPPSKKLKVDITLDEVPEINRASVMWLEMNNIVLTEEDRGIIVTEKELNDKHINVAHALLKKQFQGILGLQSTLLLSAGKQISLPASNTFAYAR